MSRVLRTMILLGFIAGAGCFTSMAQAGVKAELVADVNKGPSGSKPRKLTTVGDAVYFLALGDGRTQKLWRSDGKTTRPLVPAGVDPEDFWVSGKIAYRGRLYFKAQTPDQGQELWRTTRNGLRVELVPGFIPGRKAIAPGRMAVANGLLFFRGGSSRNRELWKFDGKRIRIVKDINPGPKGSSPSYLTSLGNRIVFGADDGTHGGELWSSDGTVKGTGMIHELTPGAEGTNMAWFNRVGQSVYFTAIAPDVGLEPWRTNGLSAQLVADLNPGEGWSHVQYFVKAGDFVYFTSDSNLWRSDDAWPYDELTVVPDPDPELGSFSKGRVESANGRVYFVSSFWDPLGPTFNYPRWFDGKSIKSLTGPPEAQSPLYQYVPSSFREFGGRTFFVINDVDHGSELRVVNGSTYRLFEDILEGESSSRPRDFTRSKNYLYFTADDGLHGREIWRLRLT